MFNKILRFKNLASYKGLIHGIFDKSWSNVSFRHGAKKEVLANRKKIAKALNIDYQRIFSLNQTHGSKIQIIKQGKFSQKEEKADGFITDQSNVFLMIKTADCFPVLMFDPQKKVIAAVHAGWRGAIEKIYLNVLLKMISQFACQPKDILIGIGPGIGACCFCHKKLIQEKLPEWRLYIKKNKEGLSLDLTKFIKDQLIEAGVKTSCIEIMDICTGCDKKFFSHFRSLRTGEPEGLFPSIIGIK